VFFAAQGGARGHDVKDITVSEHDAEKPVVLPDVFFLQKVVFVPYSSPILRRLFCPA
jgi:hypothetical protein